MTISNARVIASAVALSAAGACMVGVIVCSAFTRVLDHAHGYPTNTPEHRLTLTPTDKAPR